MRRRMTVEKLERLNNSDSQELVTTTTFSSQTPEMARRPSPRLPPPRSPLVQVHNKVRYATPTEEMVPKVDKCTNLLSSWLSIISRTNQQGQLLSCQEAPGQRFLLFLFCLLDLFWQSLNNLVRGIILSKLFLRL